MDKSKRNIELARKVLVDGKSISDAAKEYGITSPCARIALNNGLRKINNNAYCALKRHNESQDRINAMISRNKGLGERINTDVRSPPLLKDIRNTVEAFFPKRRRYLYDGLDGNMSGVDNLLSFLPDNVSNTFVYNNLDKSTECISCDLDRPLYAKIDGSVIVSKDTIEFTYNG